MATSRPPRTGNLLLDALDDGDRDVLLADSRTRPLQIGSVLMNPGDPITSVFFPTIGTLSLVAEPEAEHRVEAATIGREGVANVYAALGSREAGQQVIGQIGGEMIEVDLDTFAKVFDQPASRLRDLVLGYIEALFAQASLNTACNALHHVNERCARWLLSAHDRVDSDTFVLKQEFLAIMLGVHRPTVSIAAATLQAAGCITYKRGVITIVDRETLEDSACPCYEAIQREYRRLVPEAGLRP
jgi:CRP-like cAMP-binding protein